MAITVANLKAIDALLDEVGWPLPAELPEWIRERFEKLVKEGRR